MTTNPFYNALAALGYIVSVVSLLFGIGHILGDTEDNILFPIGGLSLLVLSVAIMAYIFFYQPILMLLDGKREEGIQLFLKTVSTFAGLVASVLLISFAVASL
jgi:hypothetical protein